jgi:hypothetical protein
MCECACECGSACERACACLPPSSVCACVYEYERLSSPFLLLCTRGRPAARRCTYPKNLSLLFQEGPRISNYFLLPSFSNDPRIAHTEDLVMGSKRKRATSLPCTHTFSLSFLFLFFFMSLSFLKTIFVANPLSCVSPC